MSEFEGLPTVTFSIGHDASGPSLILYINRPGQNAESFQLTPGSIQIAARAIQWYTEALKPLAPKPIVRRRRRAPFWKRWLRSSRAHETIVREPPLASVRVPRGTEPIIRGNQ